MGRNKDLEEVSGDDSRLSRRAYCAWPAVAGESVIAAVDRWAASADMIALVDAGFGLISIVLVILAWPGRLWAAIALVVVRLLIALTAVPAFLVPGVPAGQ